MFSSSTETAFSTAKRRFLHGEGSILNTTQGGGSGGMCLGGGELGGGGFAFRFVLRAFLGRAEEERVVWGFRFTVI
jgi:hypothetical protein